MQTTYRWHCPKCGKKYVNGKEPTYCEQSFFLKTPGHPLADESGLVETRCGAPILPLDTPEAAREGVSEMSDIIDACGPAEERMSEAERAPDGPIMEAIIRFLDTRNWRYARYADYSMLELTLGCRNATLRMVATAREVERQIIVYAMISTKVPPERRAAVAEFITRVNHDFFVGGFDLDFETGMLRFRAGIDIEGGELADKMVANLFDLTSSSADRHHERLMRVIYGGMEPKAALEAAS